jgi:hypothetical protein
MFPQTPLRKPLNLEHIARRDVQFLKSCYRRGAAMNTRTLPPLEVGQTYWTAVVKAFEFNDAQLQEAIAGEGLATLRLDLANETFVEVPASAYHFELLMCALIEAFPLRALAHLRQRMEVGNELHAAAESARR